jgi:anti-sigma B factor antagonist
MMEIRHHEIAPGTVVITISGRLVGPQSEQIMAMVEDLLAQGNRTFIFNIAEVVRIDSTGIGRFISSHNKIAAAGGEMRMAGATGHLFQAFHVTLLDTVFRFYPDVEAAARI